MTNNNNDKENYIFNTVSVGLCLTNINLKT